MINNAWTRALLKESAEIKKTPANPIGTLDFFKQKYGLYYSKENIRKTGTSLGKHRKTLQEVFSINYDNLDNILGSLHGMQGELTYIDLIFYQL